MDRHCVWLFYPRFSLKCVNNFGFWYFVQLCTSIQCHLSTSSDLLKSCLSLLANRKGVTFYGSLYALFPTEILQSTVRENVASNYKVYDQDKNGGCPKYGGT